MNSFVLETDCKGRLTALVVNVALVIALGCSTSTNVTIPAIDPVGAAARAMELWDVDGDEQLDLEELTAAPGLQAAAPQVDLNGDGSLDAGEIAARLKTYVDARLGAVSMTCTVTLNGNPLPGAAIKLVPEKFLADVLHEARGRTSLQGVASLYMENGRRIPGVQLGMYRVEIRKSGGEEETLAARYNDQTELGYEVSHDPDAGNARFDLTR